MSGNIAGNNPTSQANLREIQESFRNQLSRLHTQHRRLLDAVGTLVGTLPEKPPQTANPIPTSILAELQGSVSTLSDMTNDIDLVIDRLFGAIGGPSTPTPGQAIFHKN